jgi:hypothetical protein
MVYRYSNPRKTDHLVIPIDVETKEAIKTYCYEILEYEKLSECIRYMLKKYFQWAKVMEKVERREKIKTSSKQSPKESKNP